MPSTTPTFGVVLLNWNGFEDTAEALESLAAASPRPASVVVVDNGSQDDSVARLEAWARRAGVSHHTGAPGAVHELGTVPWLLIIASSENLGFSVGNNVGLEFLARRTRVTHFLLLNNDATVAPDYFARMHDALEALPDTGLMGCTVYCSPERHKVWYAGGHEIPWRALVLHDSALPADDRPRPTSFVTGCAMVIARSVYERQGGLAPCYTPVYWEDTEYSFRARRDGWPVAWAPAARVYHKVGATVGDARITPQVAFWQNRNRGYYVRRNYTGLDRLLALTYLVVTKPGRSVAELLRGRPALGSAIFRGFLQGLTGPTE